MIRSGVSDGFGYLVRGDAPDSNDKAKAHGYEQGAKKSDGVDIIFSKHVRLLETLSQPGC